MNSRSNILQAIASGGYPDITRPELTSFSKGAHDIVDSFCLACQRNGSSVIIAKNQEEATVHFQDLKMRISTTEMRKKEDEEILIVKSRLGVAENGAVWLDESNVEQRVDYFACSHLCVLVHTRDIVPTIHDAYNQLNGFYSPSSFPGFGVFIAGPSKTADIEQTLVIGAQGAIKHTLILIAE